MKTDQHIVNLDLPPSKRWEFLKDYKLEIEELIACYLGDFEGSDAIFEGVKAFKHAIISKDLLEEIAFLASITKYTEDEILTANLYYDLLKFYFGCTTFAIATEETILHARNLDWHTENNLLTL